MARHACRMAERSGAWQTNNGWDGFHISSTLTAAVVVNAGFGKHGVVLDLRLAHGRAVVRDDHELALAAAQALERRLEAEGVLARLDDERQPGVDVLLGLFL